MRATIDGHPYSAGLRWHLAESAADVAERRAETGLDRGVVLKRGRRIAGVGFAAGDEDRDPPPAAAALLALSTEEAVIAVEWAETAAGHHGYWFAAAAGGAVVAGTDLILEDPEAVVREIRELSAYDAEYRIAGAASAEFGGDGEPVLTPARAKALLAAAAIRSLGGTASAGQIVLLAALVGAVIATGWWVLAPDQPTALPEVPAIDRQAEERKAAIAARNQALSNDLSGLSALPLARWSTLAGRDFQRSAASWHLARKDCRAGGCTLAWDAMAEGAAPAALAAALGLDRRSVTHDLRADRVTVGVPLGAVPARIEATEAMRPTDGLPLLVDLCRRFQGRGGDCTLGTGQPPALANAQALPAELRYRIGKVTLGGHLGRVEALLPLLSGDELTPWVRADAIEFDYDRQEFHLEGHYVIP